MNESGPDDSGWPVNLQPHDLQTRIRDAMPAWADDAFRDFEFLSGGYSNANFAFWRDTPQTSERYALRIPTREQPYVDRRAEVEWYRQLPAFVGIQPTYLDPHTGLMISPWVEGELLVDVFASRFGVDDLLDYLRLLHQRLPETERHYHVPALMPDFVGTESLHADIAVSPTGILLNRNTAKADLLRSCHNDLNPWNILVTDRGWLTLDWEFAGVNDPLFDLVNLHQGLGLDDALLSEMAAALAPGVEQNRLHDAYRHFWLREWGWARFQYQAGNQRHEVATQITVAEHKLAAMGSH